MLKYLKIAGQVLKDLNVDYALVGGLAVAYLGYPRATLDIDLLVRIERERYDVLISAFEGIGASVTLNRSDLSDPLGDVFDVIMENQLIQLITSKWKLEGEAIETARMVELEKGFSLKIPTIEYMIVLKERAGSPKDRLDVENLIQVGQEHINYTLLDELRVRAGIK